MTLRIKTFQNENGRLFKEVQNLIEQLKIARGLAESLEKSVNRLKDENFNPKSKLRAKNQINTSTVVDINSQKR